MFSLTISLLLFPIVFVNCIQIPFIQNVTLIPRYKWNSTTITNRTYQQCLCMSLPSFVAFNYYPNNTCELFYKFPINYKIQSTPLARLYFPQGIFPNASQCCMPNLNYLLNKLKNGTWTYVNITDPRNLLIDNNGYLVTVELEPPRLDRFNPYSLAIISRNTISGSYAAAVGYANNYYFVGLLNGTIIVISSVNLTPVKSITSPFTPGLHGMILLDNGRTIVVTSYTNRTIAFFHRNGNASANYTYAYRQSTNYIGVHGLTSYNDSYFYATSWDRNSIYSYTAVGNSTNWIERLVVNATLARNISGGNFMTTDECGRYWFSLDTSAVYIFDKWGSYIANFSLGNGLIIYTLITDNYVMYFSDRNPNWSRIIRIDPHIQY